MDNQTAVIVVIGVTIAVINEFVKHFTKRLTTDQIQLLNLSLGLIGGGVWTYIVGGTLGEGVMMGLTAGVFAPGIYDMVMSLVKGVKR